MRTLILCTVALSIVTPASANDWERFYHGYGPTDSLIPAASEPEVIPTTGDIELDEERLWRRGFVAIGHSSFNTSNDKTRDAVRFGKKLKARYVVVITQLTSSNTASVPITLPTTDRSFSHGTVSATGSGGYASGSYSGTTTTYGNETTYIPVTINRFDKTALYFMEIPKYGAGIKPRELTSQEIALVDTRRAFAVRFVRDGSPAYNADILPGDIIVAINGKPADGDNWQTVIRRPEPISIEFFRQGQKRHLELTIPEDWRPKQ